MTTETTIKCPACGGDGVGGTWESASFGPMPVACDVCQGSGTATYDDLRVALARATTVRGYSENVALALDGAGVPRNENGCVMMLDRRVAWLREDRDRAVAEARAARDWRAEIDCHLDAEREIVPGLTVPDTVTLPPSPDVDCMVLRGLARDEAHRSWEYAARGERSAAFTAARNAADLANIAERYMDALRRAEDES